MVPRMELSTLCVRACVLSRVQLFKTPWTIARQAPLSMGFSRQEYWNGLPFPPHQHGTCSIKTYSRIKCMYACVYMCMHVYTHSHASRSSVFWHTHIFKLPSSWTFHCNNVSPSAQVQSVLCSLADGQQMGLKAGWAGAGWELEIGPSVLSTCFSYSIGSILLGLKTSPPGVPGYPLKDHWGPTHGSEAEPCQPDWLLWRRVAFSWGSSGVAAWHGGRCQRQWWKGSCDLQRTPMSLRPLCCPCNASEASPSPGRSSGSLTRWLLAG